MKRAFPALLLGLLMTFSLAACGGPATPAKEQEPALPELPPAEEIAEPAVFRAGALKGPTAMGMVRMIAADGMDTFTLAGSADELTPLLMKGELDIACVPANLAAVLYNKTEGEMVSLAVNTLGVLYIVENGNAVQSMADLEGKTVVAAGKGSTPEYALRFLLRENGLDPEGDLVIDWKSEHSECVAALASGAATVALLPQPFVTVAQGKIQDLRIALDLTAEWDALDNGSAMVTGVAVARRAFVEEQPETVARFLEEYAASVDWVNSHPAGAADLIAELGIIESANLAEKALPYCNIVCLTGQEQFEKLSGYLQVLAEADPASVGGQLPRDDFFYGA